jgi:membrane-associated phospholipid phosphatase
MFSQRIATSIDYNRGLHLPIRWLHVLWAAIEPAADALFGWTRHPRARNWAPLVLFTLGAVLILLPSDLAVSQAAVAWLNATGGDIRRELEAIQQYGQGFFMILISITIVLLDPRQRGRLLDWYAAGLVTLLTTVAINHLLGRPRPGFQDPMRFVGPVGSYAYEDNGQPRLESVWTTGYDLVSMPSRHAAFAVLASVFLSSLYPRLRGLLFTITVLVCFGRVATGQHYPTDTIMGAAIGLLVGRYGVAREWGQGLWTWLGSWRSGQARPDPRT